MDTQTAVSNRTIINGAFRVLLVLLLIAGNAIAGSYLFGWMSIASTLANIGGFVGILILLVLDILILKRVFKTTHKRE